MHRCSGCDRRLARRAASTIDSLLRAQVSHSHRSENGGGRRNELRPGVLEHRKQASKPFRGAATKNSTKLGRRSAKCRYTSVPPFLTINIPPAVQKQRVPVALPPSASAWPLSLLCRSFGSLIIHEAVAILHIALRKIVHLPRLR